MGEDGLVPDDTSDIDESGVLAPGEHRAPGPVFHSLVEVPVASASASEEMHTLLAYLSEEGQSEWIASKARMGGTSAESVFSFLL